MGETKKQKEFNDNNNSGVQNGSVKDRETPVRHGWKIDLSKLIIKSMIARGTFGIVHRVVYDDLDVAGVKVSGFSCKPSVTADDFFSTILSKPGATNNTLGAIVTAANVEKIPGLNTLGVSLSRIDFAPNGLNPPHTHPRATEIVFVLEGELDVGFITTANVLYSKHIKQGEVFVFPKGLLHFQKNNGKVPAAVIAAFNSQFPGTQSIAATLFGATPTVPDDVLSKAFHIGAKEVEKIKSKLAPKK